MIEEINVHTSERTEMIDITGKVRSVLAKNNIKDGIVIVYTPHTTAGITINENADPDVVKDILMEVNNVIPFSDDYRHREGNSAAHIKSSLFGVSETLIVNYGKLVLGTWQGIYFCEFDGSRNRKVYIKIIED